jgi:signal transduction histidine kinase
MTSVARSRMLLVDAGVVGLALLDAWLRVQRNADTGLYVSLVAALALVVRRRWPFAVLLFTLPALWTADVLIAPIAALYTLAATSRSRPLVLACAVLVGLGHFLPWPLTEIHWSPYYDFISLIFSLVYAGAPVALGFLVQTRHELSRKLAELTAGRAREQQLVSETVLAQERARLAREMHDVVSHQVSLIAVQAGALRVTATDETVRETADAIRKLSVQTLEELRQMVGVLRADGGHVPELAPQPRLGDIPRLVRGSGLDAQLELDGVTGRSWPDQVERAAYRTVQEALTNVSKHAPGAPVRVQITPWGSGLSVVVRNGRSTEGPPASHLPGGGHGLLGLRERAELLGGAVQASPTDDGGFLVEAVYPNSAGREPARQQ